MWKTEHSEETTASPDELWKLLRDADGWSSWNPGLSWARLDGPFREGAVGHTKPVKGPEGAFTITEVKEGTSFVNEAKLTGARMRFLHRIEPIGDGRARVTLGASILGPLSRVYGAMFGGSIAAYLPTAVKRLVARAEAG
jgi:hypothetical protein